MMYFVVGQTESYTLDVYKKGIVNDLTVSESTRYNRSVGVFANYRESYRGLSLRKDR
jgi:hypothetical protein